MGLKGLLIVNCAQNCMNIGKPLGLILSITKTYCRCPCCTSFTLWCSVPKPYTDLPSAFLETKNMVCCFNMASVNDRTHRKTCSVVLQQTAGHSRQKMATNAIVSQTTKPKKSRLWKRKLIEAHELNLRVNNSGKKETQLHT